MALHEDLIRAHMRGGQVGDQDAPAPVDHPAEDLLQFDLNLPSVGISTACQRSWRLIFVGAPRYQSDSALVPIEARGILRCC
jgi:hypothetical protein